MSSELVVAARTLAVDAVTAETVRALSGAGIPCLLLKGPNVARWLYPEGNRKYHDTDLLVRPEDFAAARRVLTEAGFTDLYRAQGLEMGDPDEPEATMIRRSDSPSRPDAEVDLHRALPSLADRAELIWRVFSRDPQTMTVAGADVSVPNRTCVALHIALHAVQHVFAGQPEEDLRRAIEVMPIEDWRAVRTVAQQLGVEDILSIALRHSEAGTVIADRLGLGMIAVSETEYWNRFSPRTSASMARFLAAGGWSRRVGYLRVWLWPSETLLADRYRPADLSRGSVWRLRLRWLRDGLRAIPSAVFYLARNRPSRRQGHGPR